MKKHTFPAFQFYPDHWTSSITVRSMTPAQRGCYIDLLAASWPNGIPEHTELWLLTGCRTKQEFDVISVPILKEFILKDGRYFNSKLLSQVQRYASIGRKRSAAGKLGADGKWHPVATANPLANPEALSCKLQAASSTLQAVSSNSRVTNSPGGTAGAQTSALDDKTEDSAAPQPAGTSSLDPSTETKQVGTPRKIFEILPAAQAVYCFKFWINKKSDYWYKFQDDALTHPEAKKQFNRYLSRKPPQEQAKFVKQATEWFKKTSGVEGTRRDDRKDPRSRAVPGTKSSWVGSRVVDPQDELIAEVRGTRVGRAFDTDIEE